MDVGAVSEITVLMNVLLTDDEPATKCGRAQRAVMECEESSCPVRIATPRT
jgi:hypothetical protein